MNKVLLGTVTIGSLVAGCCGDSKETKDAKKIFCECFGCQEGDIFFVKDYSVTSNDPNQAWKEVIGNGANDEDLKKKVNAYKDKYADCMYYNSSDKKMFYILFDKTKCKPNDEKIIPVDIRTGVNQLVFLVNPNGSEIPPKVVGFALKTT